MNPLLPSKNPKRLSLSLNKKHGEPSTSSSKSTNDPYSLTQQHPETSQQKLNSSGIQVDQYNDQLDSVMNDDDLWDKDLQMVDTSTEQSGKGKGVLIAKDQPTWGSNDTMDDMDDDFVDNGNMVATKSSIPNTEQTSTLNKKSKLVGEDVFTEQCVKTWQGSRIKAWEGRYLNPEGYYYRFVVPGEGQQNGGWSSKEHKIFMERYDEWVSHGWKIGASWGLFSKGIPHRVGYQCMNYYRKLVEKGKLKDDTYEIVDGKLKQIRGDKANAGDVPNTDLGPEWEDEDVKRAEKNVDQWLKQYHQRSGSAATRPISKPKPTPKPRPKSATSSNRTNRIAGLVKNQHLYKRPFTLDDDNDDFLMETTEPEQAHLASVDWTIGWNDRLAEYKAFFSQYRDKDVRHDHWVAKQKWRRGLTTTAMLLNRATLAYQKNMTPPSNTAPSPPTTTAKQASLSRFFTGVKKVKVKVDTPDEMIHHTRIPNDLYSGVKQVTPLRRNHSTHEETNDEKTMVYHEVNDMMDCVDLLENRMGSELVDGKTQSQIEGLLVDPPWEYILQDDRNDGSCQWNLVQVGELMEKVLKHMSAGLVFIWTHKLIQADVVRMMYSLDCKYVENLVWFKKSVNNLPVDQPCPYISSTKEILLMFKKGDGIELRHQRSADVIIDFEQPASQWIHEEFTEPKPPAVFDMIETLLPRAGYDEEIGRGRFVELWAKRAANRRKGWIAFHQRKDTNTISLQDMTLEDTVQNEPDGDKMEMDHEQPQIE